MKKLLFTILSAMGLFSTGVFLVEPPHPSFAQQKPIPPYAKWGKFAMEKTHEKYPQAHIVDYLHIGRTIGSDSTVEKFKLWMKDGQKEFGVFVDIEFDNKTEKVLNVKFRETSR